MGIGWSSFGRPSWFLQSRPGYTFFLDADDGIPGTVVLVDLRGVSGPLLSTLYFVTL